jgi:hypothetical protein
VNNLQLCGETSGRLQLKQRFRRDGIVALVASLVVGLFAVQTKGRIVEDFVLRTERRRRPIVLVIAASRNAADPFGAPLLRMHIFGKPDRRQPFAYLLFLRR